MPVHYIGRYLNKELYDNISKQLTPIFLKFYKTSPSFKKYKESNYQLYIRIKRNQSIGTELGELQKLINEKSIPLKYSGCSLGHA